MMWFEKKKCLFPTFPNFRFCPILEIENLETSDSFRLLHIFIVSITLSMGKVKPFIEFQINTPHVLMSIDTSHNKYILLQHGNILSICFW